MSIFDFKGGYIKVMVYSVDGNSKNNSGNFFQDAIGSFKSYDLSANSWKPFVDSVVINEKPGGSSEITVSITPPTYKEALDMLDSDIVKIGNIIAVKWGYSRTNALTSPWYYGQMYKPSASFEEGGLSFSLNAQSAGFMGARKQTGFVWGGKKGDDKKISIKEVVEIIAKKYKMKLVVNGGKKMSNAAERAFNNKQDVIFQRSIDDFNFIRLICRNIGLRVSITGTNVLNILDPRSLSDAGKPLYTLRYFGQLDIENNVYPLLSFSSDSDVMFLPDTSTEGTIFKPDDKKSESGKKVFVNSENSERVGYSSKYVPNLFTDNDVQMDNIYGSFKVGVPGGRGRRVVLPSRDENVKEKIEGTEVLDAEKAAAKATCEIFDIPSMIPEEIVRVQGVGRFFSVNYKVWDVSRNFSSGGFIDTLTLQSSGIDAYIDLLKKKSKKYIVDKKASNNKGVVKEAKKQ